MGAAVSRRGLAARFPRCRGVHVVRGGRAQHIAVWRHDHVAGGHRVHHRAVQILRGRLSLGVDVRREQRRGVRAGSGFDADRRGTAQREPTEQFLQRGDVHPAVGMPQPAREWEV